MKLIRRKYLITVEVDGHTFEDAARELLRMADEVHAHGELCNSVGGGGSSGHIVNIDIDPTGSVEKFESELEAYRLKKCEERDAAERAAQHGLTGE